MGRPSDQANAVVIFGLVLLAIACVAWCILPQLVEVMRTMRDM